MARLTQQDVRVFLELLGDLYALRPLDAFRTALLNALPRVVASELTSYHEMQPTQGTSTNWAVPSNVVPPTLERVWERHMTEHPVLAYNVRTGDGRAMQVSDFLSRSQFHRLGLYNEFFRLLGLEDGLSFAILVSPSQVIGMGLQRRSWRTFLYKWRVILHLFYGTL